MNTALYNTIADFLMRLPNLQNQAGRHALLLSAGLNELVPHVPLGGSTQEFVAPLLHRLDEYGDLADNAPAVIRLLEAAMDLVGFDRRQQLLDFCDQYRADLENTASSAKPYAPSASPDELSAAERAYLQRVCALAGQVQLAGIDRKATRADAEACLALGAIYTALRTQSNDFEARGVMSPTKAESAERVNLSALDLLNRYPRFVLLGDPGSGKSTFVKFVALCLAGELLGDANVNLARLTAPLPKEGDDDEPVPQTWDCGALLPVRIELRDFAARGLPPIGATATAQHVWQFLDQELQAAALGEYASTLKDQLRKSGGLLLFDGLDEVPEAAQRRIQIKQTIEDFANTFQRCRIVVTSRTYAYQRQEWRLNGFQEAVLAAFTDGQIRSFVDAWYRHLAALRGQHPDDAQGRAEVLKYTIFQYSRLRSLAERPLLLTLMASLHAWRGGSLPEKREELYSDTVDLLLDWWESPKIVRDAAGQAIVQQESLAELLNVGKDAVRDALNALAFRVHRDQPELVGTADIAQKELVDALMHVSQSKDLRPARLIEYLSDRAGLLVPRGVGVYAFPHRTFQEYLAACHLTDEDYPELVAALARQEPNRWREALLLAGAKAAGGTSSAIWNLAEELCFQEYAPNTTYTPADAWGALLAGQVVAEIANLERLSSRNQQKLDRLRAWLVAILTEQVTLSAAETRSLSTVEVFPPTERALAGNILAQLGDPRPGVGLRADGLPDIVWCDVPEGEFLMGSELAHVEAEFAKPGPLLEQANLDDNTKKALKRVFFSEHPQHRVMLSAYALSQYPVTNMQYQTFIKDGGYACRAYWADDGWTWKETRNITGLEPSEPKFQAANQPVVGVSWYEAAAFCAWLTARLRAIEPRGCASLRIGLPSEAQWEKAARGTDGRIYPWGNDEMTPRHANYYATQLGVTTAVGCFARDTSPYGCLDLVGNVVDWCSDWYGEKYYVNSPKENPHGPDSGSTRVMRGGSWGLVARHCRATFRYRNAPGSRYQNVGFRVCRTK